MSEQAPVFIRNLARDPESRLSRKLRPGNSLGFLLDDGRRIRRAGVRQTEVSFKDLVSNIDAFIEGVQHKYVEIVTSDGHVVTPQDLAQLKAHQARQPEEQRPVDPPKPDVPQLPEVNSETPAPVESAELEDEAAQELEEPSSEEADKEPEELPGKDVEAKQVSDLPKVTDISKTARNINVRRKGAQKE